MATYKAEFLAHYYVDHARPPAAYAFGFIDKWSRLASRFPGIANHLSNTRLTKTLLGVAPERHVTPFAKRSFTRSFVPQGEGVEVLLWPDTFNNYFHPEVAHAAAAALVAAGCKVRIPREPLCCGRPLYEFGMLDKAKEYLSRILHSLDAEIRAGTPIVGLEPACVSVFRDELCALFPFSEQAKRLARQSFLLSEFLLRAPRFPWRMDAEALVHLHCHHKTVLGSGAELEVMQRAGLRAHMPDSGCCGMAGSFGFERAKYEVSMRCAERVLAPAVRAARPEMLVIADGFSCREQIAHATGRRAQHLAQVLQEASRC